MLPTPSYTEERDGEWVTFGWHMLYSLFGGATITCCSHPEVFESVQATSKALQAKHEKIVQALKREEHNKRCFVTNQLGPQYVCTNYWIFVSTDVAGLLYVPLLRWRFAFDR